MSSLTGACYVSLKDSNGPDRLLSSALGPAPIVVGEEHYTLSRSPDGQISLQPMTGALGGKALRFSGPGRVSFPLDFQPLQEGKAWIALTPIRVEPGSSITPSFSVGKQESKPNAGLLPAVLAPHEPAHCPPGRWQLASSGIRLPPKPDLC